MKCRPGSLGGAGIQVGAKFKERIDGIRHCLLVENLNYCQLKRIAVRAICVYVG